MIQAIETHYNGYRFRSRLEARWAVFFDALGIEYVYEQEGFETGAGRYLPDFWLPQHRHWIEIKGALDTAPPLKDETVVALDKARMLSNEHPVIMLVGDCYAGRYDGHVFIGQKYAGKGPVFIKCKQCKAIGIAFELSFAETAWYKAPCEHRDPDLSDHLLAAYTVARSARFEHGETPQIIERVEYRMVEQGAVIWKEIDIITRDEYSSYDLTQPGHLILGTLVKFKGIHLDDGGVPLCAPLDGERNGGFNLGKWKPRKANVLVSNICARCIKYSLARSKRARRK